jgi:cellulose synthase (UDP-forming)
MLLAPHSGIDKSAMLPAPPSDNEKYEYLRVQRRWPFWWLLIAQLGVVYGYVRVAIKSYPTALMLALLAVILPPIFVNFWLRIRKHRHTVDSHLNTVRAWCTNRVDWPSGEPLEVLRNTFSNVCRLQWPGLLRIYVLDDAAQAEVHELAQAYNLTYVVRPNRGELKKAGNLIHAYDHTDGDFITVFDADFAPREDFLREAIPYMGQEDVGIVQTAQFFDVNQHQNYIQRYAGSLQELFFRWIQPARDTADAAICAGTNVVYRRAAVEAAGGFARVPIGEDVHSGVKLWTANYKTRYVPLCLARGRAPTTFEAVANQQYRWCRSSMLLMINEHFRAAPFSLRQRTCFWAAFLYYMSSAALLFTGSLPTLVMTTFYPNHVIPENYLPMIPAVLATFMVFPRLTRGWRIDIYRLCMINSACHLLAIAHALRGKVEAWVPTGAATKTTVPRRVSTILRTWIVGTQTLLWGAVSYDLINGYRPVNFIPTIVLGLLQLTMVGKFLAPNGFRTRQPPARRTSPRHAALVPSHRASAIRLTPSTRHRL